MYIEEPKELIRAFPLRIHKKADLTYEAFEDRIKITLTNKDTGETSHRTYYKIDEGITIHEAVKIDTILYFMHNEIGLNLWGFELK